MDSDISPMQFCLTDGLTTHVILTPIPVESELHDIFMKAWEEGRVMSLDGKVLTMARVPHPPTNVPEDDTVEYRETSSAAPEPPCHCDILELALGKGHDVNCPHYKEHPMP